MGVGLLSFAVNGVELASRAPIAAKYCSIIAGHKPGSGRLLLQGGAFSSDDALTALRTVISTSSGAPISLSPHLLTISPFSKILRMWTDITAVTASAMSSARTAFDLAFVLMFPAGDASSGRRVYRIKETAVSPSRQASSRFSYLAEFVNRPVLTDAEFRHRGFTYSLSFLQTRESLQYWEPRSFLTAGTCTQGCLGFPRWEI